MSQPLISICIANYNGVGIIGECLDSVLAQEGGPDVEIVVHDDASTDDSVALIRQRYPQVVLIASQENVGFCVANNRMAEKARGDYLLLLNNDATLMPDALSTLLSEAGRSQCPAILTLPQYDHASGTLIDRGCLLDPFFNPVPNLDLARQDVAMVIGACLWVPRTLWQELGGFPEWFGSIAEDMYLCCRARLAGYAVRVATESGYRHRVGYSFGGGKVHEERLITSSGRRRLSERNKTFVMAICVPAPLLVVLLPLHLILLWLEGGILTLYRCDMQPWRKIYAPLLPALWQARNRLLELRWEVRRNSRTGIRGWFKVMNCMPYKLRMWLRHGMPEIR